MRNPPTKYARRGHSTTDALIYLLQAVHEALDAGDSGARIFFADFSKGFDLIYHNILISELEKLDIPLTEAGSYNEALQLTKLDTLFNRRVSICKGYMNKMKCSTHPLHFLLPNLTEDPDHEHFLRQKMRDVVLYRDKKFCKLKELKTFLPLNISSYKP